MLSFMLLIPTSYIPSIHPPLFTYATKILLGYYPEGIRVKYATWEKPPEGEKKYQARWGCIGSDPGGKKHLENETWVGQQQTPGLWGSDRQSAPSSCQGICSPTHWNLEPRTWKLLETIFSGQSQLYLGGWGLWRLYFILYILVSVGIFLHHGGSDSSK